MDDATKQHPSRRGQRNNEAPVDDGLHEKTLSIDRVARVVKGGRRFRFRAIVVVGDSQGKVGIGTAKGLDVTAAVAKANEVARRNMVQVPLSQSTIYHETTAKVGGAVVLLKPARPGTGLIAGSVVRAVLEAIGVKDVLTKSLGSSNKLNVAQATLQALLATRPDHLWTTTQTKRPSKTKEAA